MGSNNNNSNNHRIDALLYQHLVTGNYEGFKEIILSTQLDVVQLKHPRDKNNVLHIAATFGHAHIVEDIIRQWPELLMVRNSQGDLPIRHAIEGGKLECVGPMMRWLHQEAEDVRGQVLVGCNNNNNNSRRLRRINTLVHIALQRYYEDNNNVIIIVKEMVELYPRVCYVMNKEGICPLYLAIESGLVEIVRYMLVKLHPFKEDVVGLRFSKGKSLLHAAVSSNGTEILEEMLKFDGIGLIKIMDNQGRTALSYAAYMGWIDQVQILLNALPYSAFISNRDGSFPIHYAVIGGQTSIINQLISSSFLLNARKQNILHVAVLASDFTMLSHLLNLLDNSEYLINQKDKDGNTPFHLAKKSKSQSLISALERSLNGLRSFQIDGDLYRLLVCGDVNRVCEIVSEMGFDLKDLECSGDGCTVLHVAASMNQSLMVDDLLRRDCDVLIFQANNKADLPIHTAAKSGMFRCLKSIVEWRNVWARMCKSVNEEGNTALHIALLNNQQEMAEYLFRQCPETAYYLNKDSICPLFLAIRMLGESKLVDEMVNGLEGNTQIQCYLKGAKSVVHIAIFTKRLAILKSLIMKAPGLIMDSLDSRGRNPLSYAAHIGYVDGVRLLLKQFPNLEFKRDKDKDESFPVHQAAKGGQLKVVKLLHPKICLLNIRQQNILHVAAETGSMNLVKYLLRMQEFKELNNTCDDNGNTPLHLAVKGAHYKTVNQLTLQKHSDGNSINNELLTPRDLFEMYVQNPYQNAPSRKQIEVMDIMLKRVNGENSFLKDRTEDQEKKTKKTKAKHTEKSTRERANTFLVVATLIISVSFTAAFSPPGSYKENNGIPNLISTPAFKVFLISNGFAFLSSVSAALTIILGMNVKRLANMTLLMGGLHIILGIMWMCAAFFAGSVEVQLSSLLKSKDTNWVWVIVRRMVEVFTAPAIPAVIFYCRNFKGFSALQVWYLLLFCPQQKPLLDFTI